MTSNASLDSRLLAYLVRVLPFVGSCFVALFVIYSIFAWVLPFSFSLVAPTSQACAAGDFEFAVYGARVPSQWDCIRQFPKETCMALMDFRSLDSLPAVCSSYIK